MSRIKTLLCCLASAIFLLATPVWASKHHSKPVTKHKVSQAKKSHTEKNRSKITKQRVSSFNSKEHSLHRVGHIHHGHATWYGKGLHGRRTASGERFDQNALTCAHRTLPFGSIVRVTNMRTQKTINVRVTDRGPYSNKYCIDVSYKAAEHLGMVHSGNDKVKLEVVDMPGASTKREKPVFVKSSSQAN